MTARRGIGRRLAEELSAARASATRIATIMKSGRDSMRARTWPESLATDLARNYVPFDGSNLTGKRMTLLSAGSGAALSRVATDAAALNKHATTCHDKAVMVEKPVRALFAAASTDGASAASDPDAAAKAGGLFRCLDEGVRLAQPDSDDVGGGAPGLVDEIDRALAGLPK